MSIIPDKLLRLFRAELTSLIQAGGGRSHNSSKEDISAQSQRNMSLCLTFLKFFVMGWLLKRVLILMKDSIFFLSLLIL